MKLDFLKGDSISTLLIWGLALGCMAFAIHRGVFWQGAKESKDLFQDIFVRIAGALLLAGFAQVLIPSDYISKVFGYEAGWKGIILAWIIGIFAPGGPIVSFPILVVLMAKGASIASVFTFLTSWSLLGIFRIMSWELPFFGFNLVMTRLMFSFWIPPLIGFLTRLFLHR